MGYNASESYVPSSMFHLVDATDASIVFSASAITWNGGATHTQSGNKAWWFDFSSISEIGTYFVYDSIADARSSYFKIGMDVYDT